MKVNKKVFQIFIIFIILYIFMGCGGDFPKTEDNINASELFSNLGDAFLLLGKAIIFIIVSLLLIILSIITFVIAIFGLVLDIIISAVISLVRFDLILIYPTASAFYNLALNLIFYINTFSQEWFMDVENLASSTMYILRLYS